MKRINAISVILALSLSLAACGGGGASESEITSGPAETFSYPDFLSEVQANQVRASETYVGNRFAICGKRRCAIGRAGHLVSGRSQG